MYAIRSYYEFFRNFYCSFGIKIYEYTFIDHDKTIAYSLSTPFASSMVFAATMKHQEAPGTTFQRHMAIARGLLSEDDYLLSEILLSPYTYEQLDQISKKLDELKNYVKTKDTAQLQTFFQSLRKNLTEE